MGTLTHVDYIIHDYLHDNIDLETAILRCRNGEDTKELARKLDSYGALTEREWDDAVRSLFLKDKLGKFKE